MKIDRSSYYRIRVTSKGSNGSSYIGSFKTKEEAETYIKGFNTKETGRPDRDTHIRGPFTHDSGHDVNDPKRQVGFVVHVEKFS